MRSEFCSAAPAVSRSRRACLAWGAGGPLLAATGLLGTRRAQAQTTAVARLHAWLDALGGPPVPSDRVLLELPDTVDNGAYVPVSLSAELDGIEALWIVVPANPEPIALRLRLPAGTEPFVATRIKMAGSGEVWGLAVGASRTYSTVRRADVRIGGCG